jgi:hypothetical protein
MNVDESKIAPENRIPRVTAATWFAFLYFNVFQYIINRDGTFAT